MFEINTLVKIDYDSFITNNTLKWYDEHYQYVFPKDCVFIFMGEIKQMPGHCILCNLETGKITAGYHTDLFVELTEDEDEV